MWCVYGTVYTVYIIYSVLYYTVYTPHGSLTPLDRHVFLFLLPKDGAEHLAIISLLASPPTLTKTKTWVAWMVCSTFKVSRG